MNKYRNKMFLYVTLITCAVLPLCYGQAFRKMIRRNMIHDEPELDDQKLRDPRKMRYSPDHLPMKWRDPYEMFEPPDDLIPAEWRDSQEKMFRPPEDLLSEERRDPHEMLDPPDDVVPDEILAQSREKIHQKQLFESPIQILYQHTACISHYKRLVNMLLNTANVKTTDGLTYKGKLEIKMDRESYSLVTEFASSNEEDIIKLQETDDILSNSLSAPLFQHTSDILLSWKDYIHTEFWNTKTILCLSSIFLLFVCRQFFQANLSLGSVFKRFIFLGWILDFSFCWLNLLQEAETNKMVTLKKFSSIPDSCDPKKLLSFWSYVVSFLDSSDDCKTYYDALHTNYFFSISPLVVFSHQLGIIVYTPAAKVGEALGSFTSGVLVQLPWGVNVLLLPVVLVFAAMVMCIVLIFLTEKSLNIRFLGIFKFHFGNDNANACKIINSEEIKSNKITEVKSDEVAQKIRLELVINIPKTEDKTHTAYEIKSVIASNDNKNSK